MELGQESFYCFWQVFEPIAADDEDIFDPRGLLGERTHWLGNEAPSSLAIQITKDVFISPSISTEVAR